MYIYIYYYIIIISCVTLFEETNKQTNKQTETERQRDRQTDRQPASQPARQTDRQTDKHASNQGLGTTLEQKLGTTNWKSYRNNSHPKTQKIYGCLAVIPWSLAFLVNESDVRKPRFFQQDHQGKSVATKKSNAKKEKKVYIRVMIYPYSHPNMMIYHHHIDPRNICPSYMASPTIPSAYLVVTLSNPWPPPIQNQQEKGYAAESQRLMYFGGELEETRTVSQDFELDLRPLPWTKKTTNSLFLMSLAVFCRWMG